MKANPSKFQAICIGKNAHDSIYTSSNIDSVEIKCDDNVTLLGINHTCDLFLGSNREICNFW